MAWVTVTEQEVSASLSGPELIAFQTAATASGQDSPMEEIIAQAVMEVRGYVMAGGRTTPGLAGTVPLELVRATVCLVRYRLITRLPLNAQAILETRRAEYDDALRLLGSVSRGTFALEDGEGPAGSGVARGFGGSARRVFE